MAAQPGQRSVFSIFKEKIAVFSRRENAGVETTEDPVSIASHELVPRVEQHFRKQASKKPETRPWSVEPLEHVKDCGGVPEYLFA